MKGLIFTLLMTYGGAVTALFKPFVGLLIYICFAIVKPAYLWQWSFSRDAYSSRIIFAGLFIGWVFAGFGNWRFGRARAIALSIACFLAWSAVSAMAAVNQQLAWATVEATAKVVIPVLIGISLIQTVEQLRQIAWVIVLSHGYLAYEFNMSYFDGFNRLVTAGFAGMDDKSVAVAMVGAAGLALFLALSTSRWLLKGLVLSLALLMIHVPLFAYSRGGMLALLVAGLTAFLVVPKRSLNMAVVAITIVLGFQLAGAEVREKFMTSFVDKDKRDESAQVRMDLWERAWDTMLQRPLIGVGPRHWGWWVQTNYQWKTRQEVHNTWLQTGAELGFPGVTAFAIFFVLAAGRLWRIARGRARDATAADGDLARMVVCGLAGFLVASQFITVYGMESPYYVAMMGAGLLKVRSARQAVGLTNPRTTDEPAAARVPMLSGTGVRTSS